jgi:plasmid stabilization system protein ParE
VKKLVVTLTVAATGDIQDIARYIARDNSNVARKFEDEFWLAVDRICVFPRTGYAIPRPDGAFLAIRVSPRFKRYSIVYRLLNEDALEIVRVLHSARDIRALL